MAFGIRSAEAVQVVGDAADQLLSCPDRVQGGSDVRLRRDDSDRKKRSPHQTGFYPFEPPRKGCIEPCVL
jgi:hypothetical protein